jgi:hypothetical protein
MDCGGEALLGERFKERDNRSGHFRTCAVTVCSDGVQWALHTNPRAPARELELERSRPCDVESDTARRDAEWPSLVRSAREIVERNEALLRHGRAGRERQAELQERWLEWATAVARDTL